MTELDAQTHGSYSGALDPITFSAHGIAIRDDGGQEATIPAVNHGREAIAVFKLNTSGAKPEIK